RSFRKSSAPSPKLHAMHRVHFARTVSRTSAAVAAVAMAATLPLSPAQAGTAAVECGSEITTSIVLPGDMECEGTFFSVSGEGITVDLDGHTLTRTVPKESPFDSGIFL